MQPRGVAGIDRYVSDDPTDSDPKDTKDIDEGVMPTDPCESSFMVSVSVPIIGANLSESIIGANLPNCPRQRK